MSTFCHHVNPAMELPREDCDLCIREDHVTPPPPGIVRRFVGAKARTSDPITSHEAAGEVTAKRQGQLTLLIWRLVKQYPNHNMRWYVNKSIEENGMDAGWYGTLGTNFSKAEEQGLIEVSGTQISEYTGREVQTYRAVEK